MLSKNTPDVQVEFLSSVHAVERDAHFAVGGEDALRRNRALEEDVVRVVGDLFQAERHEEVADPPAFAERQFVHREIGVFDHRSPA